MPIRCDTLDAPALVRFTFSGDCTTAIELVHRRREAVSDGHLDEKSAVLFDLRPATNLPSRENLTEAMRAVQQDYVWSACRAYLVASPGQFEIARHLQEHERQSMISEIFLKEPQALEWLAAMVARKREAKI